MNGIVHLSKANIRFCRINNMASMRVSGIKKKSLFSYVENPCKYFRGTHLIEIATIKILIRKSLGKKARADKPKSNTQSDKKRSSTLRIFDINYMWLQENENEIVNHIFYCCSDSQKSLFFCLWLFLSLNTVSSSCLSTLTEYGSDRPLTVCLFHCLLINRCFFASSLYLTPDLCIHQQTEAHGTLSRHRALTVTM